MKECIGIVGTGLGYVSVLHALTKIKHGDYNVSICSKNHDEAGWAYGDSPISFIMNTRLDSLTQFNNVIDIKGWLKNHQNLQMPYDDNSFIPRSLFGEYLLDVSEKLKSELINHKNVHINYYDAVNYVDPQGNLVLDDGKIKTSGTILSMGFGGDPFQSNLLDKIIDIPPNGKVSILGSGLSAIDLIILINKLRSDVTIDCVSASGRFPRVRGHFSSGGESIFDRYYHKEADVERLFSLFKNSMSNTEELSIVFDINVSLHDEIMYVENNNQLWQELIYNGTSKYLDFYMRLPKKQKLKCHLMRGKFINTRAMFPLVSAKKLSKLMDEGVLSLRQKTMDIDPVRDKENWFSAINTANHSQFINRSQLSKNDISGINVDYNCKVIGDRNIFALGPITNGCRYFTEASSLTYRDAHLAATAMLNGLSLSVDPVIFDDRFLEEGNYA